MDSQLPLLSLPPLPDEPAPVDSKMKSWLTTLHGSEFKLMRLHDSVALAQETMECPENVCNFLRPRLEISLAYRRDVENFIVVHLSTRKKAIGFEVVSNGTLDTLLVHPREVFKSAIVTNAAGIVLAHNHPSGDPTPSEADIKVTRDLIRAGQLLKIEVIDHIILGRTGPGQCKGWASLRELGYFYTS
ncbi:MAG TPA: JAB domain-containing protein [Candidatus Sulfotelmatobacter sp.]|jgi:DNA repair protein RadC|nr:JAB domain-containing protein [Candidatus Sulfotelmatobacter sp.]